MKDLSAEDKRRLIIGAVVTISIIVVAIVLKLTIFGEGAKDNYVIVGNYLILQETRNGWKQINDFNDELANKKYTIMNGNTNETNITLQKAPNNEWYFLDNNFNQVKMDDFRIATHNLNINLGNFEREIGKDKYINSYLAKNKIEKPDTYSVNKIKFDFDNDGTDENIYTLSNFSLESTNYDQKSFILMERNGKTTLIEESDEEPYMVMEILDIDNDNNYEMIVSKGVLDVPTFDSCYLIYKFENEKWTLEKDCK